MYSGPLALILEPFNHNSHFDMNIIWCTQWRCVLPSRTFYCAIFFVSVWFVLPPPSFPSTSHHLCWQLLSWLHLAAPCSMAITWQLSTPQRRFVSLIFIINIMRTIILLADTILDRFTQFFLFFSAWEPQILPETTRSGDGGLLLDVMDTGMVTLYLIVMWGQVVHHAAACLTVSSIFHFFPLHVLFPPYLICNGIAT